MAIVLRDLRTAVRDYLDTKVTRINLCTNSCSRDSD